MDTAVAKVQSDASVVDSPELDSLDHLEDRVRRAAKLVAELRDQRDAAVAERDAARKAAGAAVAEVQQMRSEMESLKGERKQVRSRIEKLLGQMDLLSGA